MAVRTFALIRDVDETGISGTGVVAEGVRLQRRHLRALRTAHRSTAVYPDLETLEAIHGTTATRWSSPALARLPPLTAMDSPRALACSHGRHRADGPCRGEPHGECARATATCSR